MKQIFKFIKKTKNYLKEIYMLIVYYLNTGRAYSKLDNNTYSKQIQLVKLENATIKSICADKLLVREYIRMHGLGDLLIPLYGVFYSEKDIKFEDLPSNFVLKLNHGCGFNLLVKDKDKINNSNVRKKLKKWRKTKFGLLTAEFHYFKIRPLIICEKYLTPIDKLVEIKTLCFHGKIEMIQVDLDRFEKHTRDFYDLKWNKLDVTFGYPNSNVSLEKPKKLEDIISYSEILSKNFNHVRVDFYLSDNDIFFSELTFTPAAGYKSFMPKSIDMKLANKF